MTPAVTPGIMEDLVIRQQAGMVPGCIVRGGNLLDSRHLAALPTICIFMLLTYHVPPGALQGMPVTARSLFWNLRQHAWKGMLRGLACAMQCACAVEGMLTHQMAARAPGGVHLCGAHGHRGRGVSPCWRYPSNPQLAVPVPGRGQPPQ